MIVREIFRQRSGQWTHAVEAPIVMELNILYAHFEHVAWFGALDGDRARQNMAAGAFSAIFKDSEVFRYNFK